MRRETLRGSPESVDEGMIDYRRMYFPRCRRLLILDGIIRDFWSSLDRNDFARGEGKQRGDVERSDGWRRDLWRQVCRRG